METATSIAAAMSDLPARRHARHSRPVDSTLLMLTITCAISFFTTQPPSCIARLCPVIRKKPPPGATESETSLRQSIRRAA